MSNSLTAFNPEFWSREMQKVFYRKPRYKAIASFKEEATLKVGDTVHRPYRSDLVDQAYTKGTAFTVQDIDGTDEYLAVDTARVVPFYVDDIDQLQNKWDTAEEFARDAGARLAQVIDSYVLKEVSNANDTIDDGDIDSGTDGSGLVAAESNLVKIFSAMNKKLDNQTELDEDMSRFAMVSPELWEVFTNYWGGIETDGGDRVRKFGDTGREFMGFKLYKTKNSYFSAQINIATNPTADDTVVLNGVTFTFKATPSAAGEVDIGGDAATSVDNLVAAITNSAGYAAGAGSATAYFEVSAANRKLLYGVSATDNTTYITLTVRGAGYWQLSETFTDTTDGITLEKQHLMAGIGRPVDLVVQKKPNIVFKDVPDKLGRNVVPWTLIGVKTFTQGAKQMVDLQLDSSSW